MVALNPTGPGGVPPRDRLMWVGVGLALLTAVAYVLIAAGLLGVGDLVADAGAVRIMLVAAGCYALGGLLILLRRRWLWVVGLVMNSLVLAMFISLYASRPAVLFSPGGISSKLPQILLEFVLVALIFTERRHPRPA